MMDPEVRAMLMARAIDSAKTARQLYHPVSTFTDWMIGQLSMTDEQREEAATGFGRALNRRDKLLAELKHEYASVGRTLNDEEEALADQSFWNEIHMPTDWVGSLLSEAAEILDDEVPDPRVLAGWIAWNQAGMTESDFDNTVAWVRFVADLRSEPRSS